MTERIHAYPTQLPRGGITEMTCGVTVRGLMQGNREDDGQSSDGNGLDQAF